MTPVSNRLPREIAPGVFWLGQCLELQYRGKTVHSYNAAFVVVGEEHTAFVESGTPSEIAVLREQFESLGELPDVRYVLTTHSEMAHSGGVGDLLHRHPAATAHGDISDFHLVFPQFVDRMHFTEPGDRFDLGGTEIVVVDCVIRDLIHSRWYFDTRSKVLFPGDGFAYSHYHEEGACGCFVEEAPSMDIVAQMERYAKSAFHWTRFVDPEPFIARLDELLFEELDVAIVAPTHGLPIKDLPNTMVEIRAGYRAMPVSGTSAEELAAGTA